MIARIKNDKQSNSNDNNDNDNTNNNNHSNYLEQGEKDTKDLSKIKHANLEINDYSPQYAIHSAGTRK